MIAARVGVLLPTLRRLGLGTVASVVAYRLACRFGFYRRLLPAGSIPAINGNIYEGSRLIPPISTESKQRLILRADEMLAGEFTYFSRFHARLGSPPDWFLDPFHSRRVERNTHWSALDEFAGGDIKIIWEPSRFEWLPLLAQAWVVSGEDHYHSVMNHWLQDWVKQNPPNTGPNWKCGQEAAIRLLNLLLTARLLGTHRQPSSALVELVGLHCERIEPTINYALAQNNNHGTSEAAALFVGGAWLLFCKRDIRFRKKAKRWLDKGRILMEDRASKLIEEDGSFAQYSTNYHRVLIDTLNQVELWRRELDEPSFSRTYLRRCQVAVEWLATMVDVHSGDGPNIGANDGARLYNLATTPYRDFRPSIQLGSVFFRGGRIFEQEDCDEPLRWLDIAAPAMVKLDVRSRIYTQGGYVVIRRANLLGVVRTPSFRFRPSHADALHLDLWHRGENLLRDGGSYNYNATPCLLNYFFGCESHNTVQFDGRDQMPRLGRFLYGAWLKMDESSELTEKDGNLSWSGAYTDSVGCRHQRFVEAGERAWKVIDVVRGYREKAELRWRLAPAVWTLSGRVCSTDSVRIEVAVEGNLRRMELVMGWESRHYMEKTELPVLEIEAGPVEARFITIIEMKG